MISWHKKGVFFQPDNSLYWQNSHAALPTALYLGNEIYRIYFTSRDKDNKTHVGYFDWDLERDLIKRQESTAPILSPGPLGFFDDHGVQATSVIEANGKVYMYYLGWNPALTKPLFYTSIGLAISDDGGNTFTKYSKAPIMSRSEYDPWMVSGGTVRKEGNIWKMWYLSGIDFQIDTNGQAISRYDIKYAESTDGINWHRNGHVCLPLADDESNISRLSIIQQEGLYKAWYPVKKLGSLGYRIGYAESKDGLIWDRQDHLSGIDVSEEGWDSQALDKQEVILHNGKYYMLYNGNSFGRDGIGLATFE
tara:strand:- start:73335 stop:74255 length:921 start_codon:yes stop_codon:yes gene_type:complete